MLRKFFCAVNGFERRMSEFDERCNKAFDRTVGRGFRAAFSFASGQCWLEKRGIRRFEYGQESQVLGLVFAGAYFGLMAGGIALSLTGSNLVFAGTAVAVGFLPSALQAAYVAGKHDQKMAAQAPRPQ